MDCAKIPNVYFVSGTAIILFRNRITIMCAFGNRKELGIAGSLPEQRCGIYMKPLTACRRFLDLTSQKDADEFRYWPIISG